MEALFAIYKKLLLLHVGTKTNEPIFHEKSAGFYELLFDIFHEVSEKNQDIWEDKPVDCKKATKDALTLLEEAKWLVEDMIEESNTYGKDNLLRWLADKLEFQIGTAKSLVEEEDEPKLGLKNK